MFRVWRRVDQPGLETLRLSQVGEGWRARSVIIDGGDEPFSLQCDWRLDVLWRSLRVRLEIADAAGERSWEIERAGPEAWLVNGEARADLDGCGEVDVSATPLCNALAIRRLGALGGELTALYVLAPALSAEPSRQRYEPLGAGRWRYADLGAAKGFTAILELDSDGLVRTYEHLFEAIG
jgi:uncharacterized protein